MAYNEIEEVIKNAGEGLDLRWIQKVESGEINMENITVKRFFSLLKGISQCADDCDESRQIQIIREAYSNFEQLLKKLE